jgi:hypothetical protein
MQQLWMVSMMTMVVMLLNKKEASKERGPKRRRVHDQVFNNYVSVQAATRIAIILLRIHV